MKIILKEAHWKIYRRKKGKLDIQIVIKTSVNTIKPINNWDNVKRF